PQIWFRAGLNPQVTCLSAQPLPVCGSFAEHCIRFGQLSSAGKLVFTIRQRKPYGAEAVPDMPIHVKDADPIPPEAVIHTGLYDLQCFVQALFRWDERVHPDDDFLLRKAAVYQGLKSLELLIRRWNARFQDT